MYSHTYTFICPQHSLTQSHTFTHTHTHTVLLVHHFGARKQDNGSFNFYNVRNVRVDKINRSHLKMLFLNRCGGGCKIPGSNIFFRNGYEGFKMQTRTRDRVRNLTGATYCNPHHVPHFPSKGLCSTLCVCNVLLVVQTLFYKPV